MSHSTKQTQQDILHTQTNIEEEQNNSNSSTEIIQREKIINTPFEIVGNTENGYFIAMGKYKITENKQSIEDAKKTLNTEQWIIITNMIILIAAETYKGMENKE